MNEELQKELLSILRAMKEGAPGAWQVLVEQRATYCLTLAAMHLAIALVLAIVGVTLLRWQKSGAFLISEDYGPNPTARFWLTLVGTLVAAIAFAPLGCGAMNLAEGLAPLGRVLEAIR